MKGTDIKRGSELYEIMCRISDRFAILNDAMQPQITEDSALSRLKAGWYESLVACNDSLDKCIRVMPRLLPSKNAERNAELERQMKELLDNVEALTYDSASFYSLIPNMIKPDIDRLYQLMNEYVQL